MEKELAISDDSKVKISSLKDFFEVLRTKYAAVDSLVEPYLDMSSLGPNIDEETLFLSDDKIFYTLEGEGWLVGRPSVFMRLSMCNLTCKGFASPDAPYGCDSYISWSVKNKMTFKDIYQLMSESGFCERLKNNQTILKVTGGEPLIQQKKLSKFILYFNFRSNFMPRIDFETNGTILPDNVWTNYCGATFTVSPKLSSNGDPEDKRYVPEVLEWHANNIGGSYFKFVVQTEKDIEEIAEKYINKYSINADRVWFMPCCGSRAEHTENATRVAEWSKQWNVNFSPRLHLVLWDKALKV